MQHEIPQTMRAIVTEQYHEDVGDAIAQLKVKERPVPRPKRGQVLVRIEAAPCNPSDLIFLQGKYGVRKTLPAVPGWEGAGTVVASGGGWLASWLSGKRVACGAQGDRDGTWAEYVVANAAECIPLKKQLDIKQAASLIINPLTAMALLETAQTNNHKAAIQTGGASQLGRMLIRMAVDANFPLVSVVRRQEQVELLRSIGATHILNSSDEDFFSQTKALCEKLSATAAFDAVGGEMTGNLINAMPANSTAYVYGALSEEACGNLDPVELIFHNKSVSGFFLGNWLKSRGAIGILRAANRIQKMLIAGEIATQTQREITLEEVHEGLTQYQKNMTAGKVLFVLR
jgi:NADPH:quinone reductase-like Zn-dependent oxidoreductase